MTALFLHLIIVATTCSLALVSFPVDNRQFAFSTSRFYARSNSPQTTPPNRGAAPSQIGGVGRLDLRVFDSANKPIAGARALFRSKQLVGRKKGGVCESWNDTDAQGLANLPALQIGEISVIVTKPGYRKATRNLQPSELANPITIILEKR